MTSSHWTVIVSLCSPFQVECRVLHTETSVMYGSGMDAVGGIPGKPAPPVKCEYARACRAKLPRALANGRWQFMVVREVVSRPELEVESHA